MSEFIAATFGVLTYPFFLRLFFGTMIFCGKLKRKKYFWLRIIACMSAYLMIGGGFMPFGVTGVLANTAVYTGWFIVSLIWLYICFDEQIQTILFCCLAGYTTQQLAGSVNVLIVLFMQRVGFSDYSPIIENPVLSWFSLQLIYIVVYICIYFVLVNRLKTSDFSLKRGQLIVLSTICLFADIVLQLIAIEDGMLKSGFAFSFVICGYNILSCLFIYYLQFSSLSTKHLREEISALNELWAQQQKQYILAKETIDHINIKCHDLKHQIRQITKGSALDRETAREIENAISIYDSSVKTGNEALDVILTEKSLLCNERNIRISCIADGLALSFMKDADIYSLFGNALDNAIEAVEKLDDKEKRIIGLKVKSDENFIVIHIYNYFFGNVEYCDGGPRTSKDDKENHGFGVKSMLKIVERYDGNFSIHVEGDVFNLSITFQK